MRTPARPVHGFTLVELLVALAAMALLGAMAWRGLDGMGRAQSRTQAFGEQVQALQAGLGQWDADLDAMAQSPTLSALDFDGRILRITRQVAAIETAPAGVDADIMGGGFRVVAWGVREVDGQRHWLRWQSALLHSRAEWTMAWQQAAWWGQNPTADMRRSEVAVSGADEWQVYYYRGDAWTNPLSSEGGASAASGSSSVVPDGVRLVLTLTAGQAISGRLTRDWVRPNLGSGRS